MSSNIAKIGVETTLTSNPLDVIPDEIPFDVPYGLPISLGQAHAVIQAAVAEARKRNWNMNVAVADSGGNLVAFQRMDGAMLASIQRMVFSLCISIICSRSTGSLRPEVVFHSSTEERLSAQLVVREARIPRTKS
jgi:hypothetical protein